VILRFARWLLNALFGLLTTRRVEGLENIPSEPPYILATNHLSFFDVPWVVSVLGAEGTTTWVAEKYERHPFFGPIVRLGDPIFIQRGEVDRNALQAAVEALRSGRIFAVAPEGTRSKTGGLIRGKSGCAYLAQHSGAPIVPVAITGTEDLGRRLLRLRRPKVTLRVGRPFRLEPLTAEARIDGVRQQADEVMCRIAALLPARYRGVYADHPRLKRLLDADRKNSGGQ